MDESIKKVGFVAGLARNAYWRRLVFPHREKTMVPAPSVPGFPRLLPDRKALVSSNFSPASSATNCPTRRF